MTAQTEFDEATVQDVVRLAGGHDSELRELTQKYDPAMISRLLVAEILSRCPPPSNDTPVLVELAIVHGSERFRHFLRVVRDSPIRPVGADEGFVGMLVEYELTELLRELFGVTHERPAGVRGTKLFPYLTDDEEAVEQIGTYLLAAQQGTEAVLAGCGSRKPDLSELSSRYFTPKFGFLHWFTPHYDRHFRDYRNQQVRVLEIGVGGYKHPEWGGGSLRMWKSFFPRGQIYGLDIMDKSHVDELRIRTIQGDQNDAEFLDRIARRYGPFDIVIDDGSHINAHVRTSFAALFPHVRPGGLYVIEDMWTAYWPGFGGQADPQECSGTSLGLLKSLIDAIQHQELPSDPNRSPGYVDRNIVGLHVYHNVAFVEKGRNDEGGIPTWIPRDFESLVQASSGGAT
uniref:Mycinamicin VI 2''-O-methyltransferase n=2 Tax=Micromonospora griseorubida TaxID=28040 RepID=MYCE_MICGR|nr:RecName: Full=Mycinamicin VI 2''-O-methyltransferase; AltName: Full=Mycinamicin biosynthesis protein E [Micromonospora griseorubida]BAC57026.1 methyltransferase [Micromonospora griseorubida]